MTPPPVHPRTTSLGLRRVQGEAAGEIVYMATFREYTFWLKHEYDTAPWEWIIVEGRYPVDLGQEKTEDEAAARLENAIRDVCPQYGFGQSSPGLIGRLRDLVGL